MRALEVRESIKIVENDDPPFFSNRFEPVIIAQ